MRILRRLRKVILKPVLAQNEALKAEMLAGLQTLHREQETMKAVLQKNASKPGPPAPATGGEPDALQQALDRHRAAYGTHVNISDEKLTSSICRPLDLLRYSQWTNALQSDFTAFLADLNYTITEDVLMHRKMWEYVYIAQALHERGLLAEGKRGLGFAVGQEPMPALFAGYGCSVLASDLGSEEEEAGRWIQGKQHADDLKGLARPSLCPDERFYQKASFQYLDMNNIPDQLNGFDFCWSSCAFEHLGSIDHGKKFIKNMLNCLKPGGWAVHTTEFNLSSNDKTLTTGPAVLFRARDFEEMVDDLTREGHGVEPLDFRLDGSHYDALISRPPYNNTPHFKPIVGGFLTTSQGLIIRKKS